MDSEPSISHWLQSLQQGGPDRQAAADALFNRFYERLIRAARRTLGSIPKRDFDEHDVVQNAVQSFFGRIEEGKFPDLRDRSGLWPLLLKIVERKALNQIRHANAECRGGGGVLGISAFEVRSDSENPAGFDQVALPDPTPEDIASFRESLALLFAKLTDGEQMVARDKLSGYKNREIAERRGCAIATVERRLRQIREAWAKVKTRESNTGPSA